MKCKNREELRFWEAVFLAYMTSPKPWITKTPEEFADFAVARRREREPEAENTPSGGPYRGV